MMQDRNLEDAYVVFKTEILIHEIFHILGQEVKSTKGISDEMEKSKIIWKHMYLLLSR